MKYSPTQIAFLLIAAVSFCGCALKPRAKSRFAQPVSASSACDCYSCRQAAATSAPTIAPPPAFAPVPVSAPATDCQTCQPDEFQPDHISPQPIMAEPVKSVAPMEPGVNVESLNTAPLIPFSEELPVIEEVNPSDEAFRPEVDLFGTGSMDEMDADTDNILIAPSDPEPTLAQQPPAEESNDFGQLPDEPETEEPAPASPLEQAATDLLSKPAIPEPPATAPASVEPVAVPDPIEVPQPARTFTPGQPFKPGQTFRRTKSVVSPSDSTMIDRENQQDGQRVVLRADKVEQNVIYSPPVSSSAAVAVTPLPATFRTGDDSLNWLRRADRPTFAATEDIPRVYEVTDAGQVARANSVTTSDGPFLKTIAATPVSHATETQIRLKAFPLARSVVQPQVAVTSVTEQSTPQPATLGDLKVEQSVATPVKIRDRTEEPVRVASPPKQESKRPYTARATEQNGFETPPWRIK